MINNFKNFNNKGEVSFTSNEYNKNKEDEDKKLSNTNSDKVVYVLCGNKNFCQDDLSQLDSVNILNKQIELSDTDQLKSNLYLLGTKGLNVKNLHISAHGNQDGISFDGKIIDKLIIGSLFNTYLKDINVIFLASCKSIETAQYFNSFSNITVAIIGDILNNDSKKLVKTFWHSYLNLSLTISQIESLIQIIYPEISRNMVVIKK